MRVFVTGATGFIGRHLVKQLRLDGHLVTINNLESEISLFSDDVKTYNLGKKAIVECIEFFESEAFDGVIHLASFVQSGAHNPNDVDLLIDTNIKFSAKLIEVAATAKTKWLINTGTYWQHFNNKPYSPVNLYAATKQAFEDIAKFYIEANKIKFCTLKLFDTFGPDDTRPKIFNLWDKIAKTGEAIDMSPGNQLMDISYIDDIISAFVLLAGLLQANDEGVENGSVYAVIAAKRYTLKELAVVFEKATNQKLNINWGGRHYRENEVMIPWEGGETVPGWTPVVSIEEGIKRLNFKKSCT